MHEIEIRNAARDDLAEIVEMLREFAAFEKLEEYCTVTEKRLETAAFGPDAIIEVIVAKQGNRTIGYAIYYPNFTSFGGLSGYYLEDLYVREGVRGRGIGESLLREVARAALARGFERIDFEVLKWNEKAIHFYERLGAESNEDNRHFKFAGIAFDRLGSE
ncbi:MAG: N-acetyltransferase family protein [Pyrinomonadaceae bacterium]